MSSKVFLGGNGLLSSETQKEKVVVKDGGLIQTEQNKRVFHGKLINQIKDDMLAAELLGINM